MSSIVDVAGWAEFIASYFFKPYNIMAGGGGAISMLHVKDSRHREVG